MIIAIDGPAASGKSTVARGLARRLDLLFLDTGAMYRAVALEVLARKIDPTDGDACEQLADTLVLTFDGDERIMIDGRPGEPDVRSAEVTRVVSEVAAHPGVRRALVTKQRIIADRAPRGLVAEGRDTTSVVFPGADHKFFLIASSRERARRRALEEGTPARIDEIQSEIERRDAYDSTRADSPLIQTQDALAVETDERSPQDVEELLVASIQAPQNGVSA